MCVLWLVEATRLQICIPWHGIDKQSHTACIRYIQTRQACCRPVNSGASSIQCIEYPTTNQSSYSSTRPFSSFVINQMQASPALSADGVNIPLSLTVTLTVLQITAVCCISGREWRFIVKIKVKLCALIRDGSVLRFNAHPAPDTQSVIKNF